MTGGSAIVFIIKQLVQYCWHTKILRDQLPGSAVSHGSRYTTEQSLGMKSLALPLIHYYCLFMYMWTKVKHQMHLCGSRELQHTECTRIYCDAVLSDSRHDPEVIFDGSFCPSDSWLRIPCSHACVVFFNCLMILTALNVAVSCCGVSLSKRV